MIQTVLIATAMMGIASFWAVLTMATVSTPSWIEQPPGSIQELYLPPTIEQVGEDSFHSHRFFVQRKSSKPPGESHRGRASSSPAGSVAESGRESGRALDPSEGLSQPDVGSTSHQRPEESVVTPKKGGDPVEGGRKSQPATKRRGGVVK